MRSLPNEQLLRVLVHLDGRNLARAICVSRRWAATGTDTLCASSMPREWLRTVAAPERYAAKVQQLTSARAADVDLHCAFPNVRRMAIELALLDDQYIGRLIFVVGLCGRPQPPLHIAIYRAASAPATLVLPPQPPTMTTTTTVTTALTTHKRLGSTAFYFFAAQKYLRSLNVEVAALFPLRLTATTAAAGVKGTI